MASPPPTPSSGSPARGFSGQADQVAGPDVPDEKTGEAGLPGQASDRSWSRTGVPGIPWTRMLFIGLVCFGVWVLLDAPSLHNSAVVSPLGVRRTVSLDITGPIATVSRGLGLSHVVGWTDEALGRTPGGGPSLNVAAPVIGGKTHPAHPLPPPKPGVAPTTTSTTLPPLNLHPTAADPLRVLVLGDSIGIDLGQPLVNDLSNTGVVSATLDGRVDTGLARPDYFNWPAELQIDRANHKPQLVVVMMGANDPQSLVGTGGSTPYGSPQWNGEYGQRVGAFIDEATAGGAHVLWVGMPPMAGSQLNSEMQDVNAVVQQQVAARPGVATYLSSEASLGDAQGNFTAYLPSASGSEINVRTPDGIHLAPGGGERLSQAVLASMRSTLKIGLPGS
jgi:lysophospholipase L1-like esterase